MISPGLNLRLVPAPSPDASPPVSRVTPAATSSSEVTLEQLYQEHAHFVAAMASRVLGRASEVDDVVQDVFAAAVHGLRRREDPREIRGWLAKVTVRRCVRLLR